MRFRVSKLLEALSSFAEYVEYETDRVRLVDFAVNLEHKAYDKILNSNFFTRRRINKAAQILYSNIRSRDDREKTIFDIPSTSYNDGELLLQKRKEYVRSGHYFNVGEIYSATKEVSIKDVNKKVGVLIEHRWMERASIDGKLDAANPNRIGNEVIREVPHSEYRSIIKKYFDNEIHSVYMP